MVEYTDKTPPGKKPKATNEQLKKELIVTLVASIPAVGLNLYIFEFLGGIGSLTASSNIWTADIILTALAIILWVRLYNRTGYDDIKEGDKPKPELKPSPAG